MRRLYQKIYLTIVASLVLVVIVAGAVWRLGAENTPAAQAFEMAGELIAVLLPAAECAPLPRNRRRSIALQRGCAPTSRCSTRRGELVASTGSAVAAAAARQRRMDLRPPGAGLGLHLPDGRWFVVRASPRHRAPFVGLLLVLGSIALAVAVGAYPVVRGLTRRLERLQTGVETLGAGNLAARVKVEGRDEVARVADAFNRSAARIEELVNAHRMLLAHASHELRTPLSRLRLAHRAVCENRRAEIQGPDRARHRRAGCAGRRDPAVEPAECPSRAADGRGSRPAGDRRGGMRAQRGMHARRHAGDRAGRCAAAAAPDPQPARQCATARRAAGPGRAAAGAQPFRARRHRCRAGHPARPNASGCSRRSTG